MAKSSFTDYLNDCASGRLDEMDTAPAKPQAPIDWDRDEGAACQRGTVGCPVDHRTGEREWSCETW
jgi:hypothetical protein